MSPRLRDEIKQSKPFGSRAEEAYLNLQRTANLLDQQQAHFFKGYGLTPTQYNALRILRGAHPESLPCREVGDRMVTPVPDVTRLLDRLETKGLVARSRDARDRRVVNVRIVDAGLELLAEIDPPLRRWIDGVLGPLDDAELATLIDLLERARTHHAIDS